MNNNIKSQTLKNDLCIGCGICAASCPFGAIKMERCSENYEKPIIDEKKCINCGICTKMCPHTFEKVISEAKKVANYEDYQEFGMENVNCYLFNLKDDKKRLQSASGGGLHTLRNIF